MDDQATELRRLVLSNARPDAGRIAGPRTLVVSGGKAGVGATTLAVNLASALAGDALRVVLVDADLQSAEVAAQCGLTANLDIGDVLAGRKNVHEALARGPAGMQILAGNASAATRDGINERSLQRIVRQMHSLQPHADWVIVDAGNRPTELTSRFWSSADQVLLVTSPDAAAVMDSYALIKTLLSRHGASRPLALAVNQVDDAASAADVHRRIDQSCRRFLGLSLELVCAVPYDPAAGAASRQQAPAVVGAPDSMLAETVSRLARRLVATPRMAQPSQRAAA